MAESGVRKPSLSGEDSDFDILQEWQEDALVPMKEDITEWLNKTLGCDIKVDNLMPSLDNGTYLCKLAAVIQDKAQKCTTDKAKLKGSAKYKENAQSGTWFARDNIANFLKWCRENDVKEECLFETEDLVSNKNEKGVILCLMELARMGIKYGLDPPRLIALEKEIEQEERNTDVTDSSEKENTPKTSQSGKPQKKSVSSKCDKLDTEVTKVTMKCSCSNHFQVDRISPGHYVIGGKNMFVRLLKGKHIMVRVGGGWDTLEHYLATHDPCRIVQFKRDGNAVKKKNEGDYAYARGRYKSASTNRKASVS